MKQIVKLKTCWAFPGDGVGKSAYISGGTFDLLGKDNIAVYFNFHNGYGWKKYYTDIANALYIGPDTEKATLTSISDAIFGASTRLAISNLSNLRLTLIASIDSEGVHKEQDFGEVSNGALISIPDSWIDIVKNSEKEFVKFRLQSWEGDNLFGEDIKSYLVSVPDSIVPVIDSVSLAPENSKVPSSKGYFDKIGRIKAYVKGHASRGASLSGISIRINNLTQGGTISDNSAYNFMAISDIIPRVGNIDVFISLKDSRGRVAQIIRSISAKEYIFPAISNARLLRANADGSEANEGIYAKPKGMFHITSGFSTILKLYQNGTQCTKTAGVFGTFAIDKNYNLELVISDGYYEGRYHLILESAYCLLNVKEDAVAIGGYAKESGFEVFLPLASNIKNSIKKSVGEIKSHYTITLGAGAYDNINLWATNTVPNADKGYILWIDGEHSVYDVQKVNNTIKLFSNESVQGKILNVLETNADVLAFVGKVEKNENKTILTNYANKENLIHRTWQDGWITFKEDRVECRPTTTGRKVIATNLIDITNYSRVYMYGNLHYQHYDPSVTVYFGVLKQGALDASLNPINAFYAKSGMSGLQSNGFVELDISAITGERYIGAYGIGSWDTFKFELLR